jgi:leucyl-tRNA synthetase
MGYPFQKIEKKWQTIWESNQIFKAELDKDRPKYYVLDMFPYPSGAGLHVGHPLGYIASDIISRYKRHKGYNVLHPQGYDSFGLPAEQYAIQTGQHPATTTKENIKRYREQLDRMGFSFDWTREVRTSDPEYYRWTQWIFSLLFDSWYDKDENKALHISILKDHLKTFGNLSLNATCDENTPNISVSDWANMSDYDRELFLLNYRLAYLAETEVNWCSALGTVLANDEITHGVSERGGHPVERKKMMQWSMRISAYADRLLTGLNEIDWPEPLKEMQRNWIGKSVGARVRFKIESHNKEIEVFTTRADTLFGVTFLTLAPEHEWVKEITISEQKAEVEDYITQTSQRSERERISDISKISGVCTGAYAIHPITNERISIWIGDYVLAGYGTGAVMAVPCGDQRDFDFATHFGLPIKNVFKNIDISQEAFSSKEKTIIANSDFLDGLSYIKASKRMIDYLKENSIGDAAVTYRLRDAVFSRQRYWGEPIPVYYVNGVPKLIPDSYLPLSLPEVSKYLPTNNGTPPLGNATNWAWDTKQNKVVSNDLIDQKAIFPLEKNTMPGWAGSSWYFNRYMDSKNKSAFASKESLEYWKEVDLYLGGSEHATGHLLYSRFWQYFLYDLELVPVKNYAKKLINQGMILGKSALIYRVKGTRNYISKGLIEGKDVIPVHVDISLVSRQNELDVAGLKKWQSHFNKASFEREGDIFFVDREIEKMSKSKYNVVNPDEICDAYGADTLRMYEMFLGPIEQAKPWNTNGISGVSGFLNKFWRLFHDKDVFTITNEMPSKKSFIILNKTIEKITKDIESFSLNTSVSAFMIATNELTSQKCHHRDILEPLTILLAPFAPHICEELWFLLGHKSSITTAKYPIPNQLYLKDETKEYPISFNGKMRFTLLFSTSMSSNEIENAVLKHKRTQSYLQGKSPKKVIIVPNKIVNIVV